MKLAGDEDVSLNLVRVARLSEVGHVAVSSHGMTAPLPVVFGMTSAFEVEFVDDVGVTQKGFARPPGDGARP